MNYKFLLRTLGDDQVRLTYMTGFTREEIRQKAEVWFRSKRSMGLEVELRVVEIYPDQSEREIWKRSSI